MLDKKILEDRKKVLQSQLTQIQNTLHQLLGAIAIIDEFLVEENKNDGHQQS